MYDIRFASEKDIPIIQDIAYKTWPDTYKDIISPEQIEYMLDLMYSESSLLDQYNLNRFYIVENTESPAGFYSIEHTPEKVSKLHKLYVIPLHQGLGLGRMLIRHVLNNFMRSDSHSLILNVNKKNPAIEFYKAAGFVIHDSVKLDIGNGYFMDDFIMIYRMSTG